MRFYTGLNLVALVGAFAFSATAKAQTRLASNLTVDVNNVTISTLQNSINSNWGTISDVSGTPGSTSTLFRFGLAGGGATSRFLINSTSTSPASMRLFSDPTGSNSGSGVANSFNVSNAFTLTMIGNLNNSSNLYIRANDSTSVNPNIPSTYLDLTNSSNLTSLNSRLNAIYKFDSSQFFKSVSPNTTVDPVLDGIFTYSFSNFSGGQFRSIDLVYTPTPEPGTILALTAFGGLALARFRRRRSL